jgi:CHASE2 domain-containing sensor protein
MQNFDERSIRGAFMVAGLLFGSAVAFHLVGWFGVAGLLAAYCVYRAA